MTYDDLLQIAAQLLEQELAFLANQGRYITPTEAVLPFLVRRGFHPRLGARPMRDAVEKAIGDAVAHNLLTGGHGCGLLDVDPRGDDLKLRPIKSQDRAGASPENQSPI